MNLKTVKVTELKTIRVIHVLTMNGLGVRCGADVMGNAFHGKLTLNSFLSGWIFDLNKDLDSKIKRMPCKDCESTIDPLELLKHINL